MPGLSVRQRDHRQNIGHYYFAHGNSTCYSSPLLTTAPSQHTRTRVCPGRGRHQFFFAITTRGETPHRPPPAVNLHSHRPAAAGDTFSVRSHAARSDAALCVFRPVAHAGVPPRGQHHSTTAPQPPQHRSKRQTAVASKSLAIASCRSNQDQSKQLSPAQPSLAQHSTAQHSTAQRSTTHVPAGCTALLVRTAHRCGVPGARGPGAGPRDASQSAALELQQAQAAAAPPH